MSKPSKPSAFWLIGLWLVIIFVWAGSGFWLSEKPERGTFGDMFGAINALFSGLAFATLIYTTWLQREELALQREELASTREELAGQKEQLEQQSGTFELQRFESTFFSLLEAHRQIVSSMDLVGDNNRVTKSRDCFKVWYKRLKNIHAAYAFYQPEKDAALATVQDIYSRLYDELQSEVGHYFRTLYHIVKLVNESGVPNKQRYTSLARAQLSSYEQAFLFYNCLSTQGDKKFKPLVEKYALLENLPTELLLFPRLHIPLYAASAYGDDYDSIWERHELNQLPA